MKKNYLLLSLLWSQLCLAQTRGLYVPDSAGVHLAQREKRIALVIGNKSYQHWQRLTNPVNDAHLMATVLTDCGFSVTELSDANKDAMIDGIETFAARISGTETVALFFYAGHGIEAFGKNYLIPTSDNSKCRDDLSVKSVDLEYVQRKLSAAAMTIMVVDACRNNRLPFTCVGPNGPDRGDDKQGFAETKPDGIFIGFSTAPGTTALDGTPQTHNSPYTAALAAAIRNSTGEEIETVFKTVRSRVKLKGQIPWLHSGYDGKFFFKPPVPEPERDKDSDGDGILDRVDNCPNERGPLTNNGCPVLVERDSDGDGIADNADKCPYEKGTRANNGCPVLVERDSDGDGIADNADKCPYEKGTRANNGCPPPANPVPANMALIAAPTSSYKMGNLFDASEGSTNEQSGRSVTLKPFVMDKHETSFAEYDAFCEDTKREKPSDNNWGRGNRPVMNVSWFDACEYANWRSRKAGKTPCYTISGDNVSCNWNANGYRLPTEAEWEYAASWNPNTGKKARFGNGKDIADPVEMNFDGSKSYVKPFSKEGEYRSKTVPVGSFSPNPQGLYDMAGNVWEWCWDWYSNKYSYSNSTANPIDNPKGIDTGFDRVSRGGSWNYNPEYCRATARGYYAPTARGDNVGFRLVSLL